MNSRTSPCRHVLAWSLSVLLALSTSGCLTPRLWSDSEFREFAEPADDPHLQLGRATPTEGDLLVQYDEIRERSGNIRRRAYWLGPNEARVRAQRKPQFLKDSAPSTVAPVAILAPGSVPAGPDGFCAVTSPKGHSFTLYADAVELGSYDLPVYQTSMSRATQILLTPLAATADVVLVVATLGGVLVFMWWEGGGGSFSAP